MVRPSGLFPFPSRRGSWFNRFAPLHVGFGVLLLCVLGLLVLLIVIVLDEHVKGELSFYIKACVVP